jgi:predicted N-acetyltransferase YhbS
MDAGDKSAQKFARRFRAFLEKPIRGGDVRTSHQRQGIGAALIQNP